MCRMRFGPGFMALLLLMASPVLIAREIIPLAAPGAEPLAGTITERPAVYRLDPVLTADYHIVLQAAGVADRVFVLFDHAHQVVARGGEAGQALDRLRLRLEGEATYHLMVASRQVADHGRSFTVQVLVAPAESTPMVPDLPPVVVLPEKNPVAEVVDQVADLGSQAAIDAAAERWQQGPFLLPGRVPIGRADRQYLALGDDPQRPVLLLDDAGGSLFLHHMPEADPPTVEWVDDSGTFQIISDEGDQLRIREGHVVDGVRGELVIDRRQDALQVHIPGQAALQVDGLLAAAPRWRVGDQPLPAAAPGILYPISDAAGRVTAFSRGRRIVLRVEYEGDGRHPLRQMTALGHETRFELDDHDRPLSRHDPDGLTTVYSYDDASRRYTLRRGTGPVQTMTEDDSGRLIASDDGHGRRRQYRWLGAQMVGLDLEGFDVQDFVPFGDAGLSVQASGLGGMWASQRLAPGLIERHDPDGRAVFFLYDPNDRLQRIVDAEEVELASFIYDGNGTVVRAASPDEVISTTSLGSQIEESQQCADVVVTSMLGDDGLLQAVEDSLGHQIRYQYDADGLLEALHHSRAGSFRIRYDAMGQMVGVQRPNGVHSAWRHDAMQRLSGWEHVLPGDQRLAQDWDHDDQGRMIRRRIEGDRPLVTRYDQGVWEIGLRDGGSSRIERALWGAWQQPGANSEIAADGRLLHWHAADGSTSLRVSYDWDHRPQQLVVSGALSVSLRMGYDAWGRVSAVGLLEGSDSQIGAGLRFVYYDDQIYAVRHQGGGVDTYLRLPGSGLLLALIRSDGTVLYPLCDHHGTPHWYSDAAGAVVHTRLFDPGASPRDPAAFAATPCVLGAFGQVHLLDGMLLLTPGRWWWTPARRALSLGGVRPGQPRLFDHDPFAFPPAL